MSGWGVFSTLKVTSGVLFAFERHWARICRDAAILHVTVPEDAEKVGGRLHELVEANQAYNATLRLILVRNHGGMWAGAGNGRPSDLIALTADSKQWGAGARLTYTAQARHAGCQFAGTKSLSWAMNLTWLEEAQAKGFDEVILLNERGEVSECTSANIFIAQGNQVWTPPLSSGCLPGITRELLLSDVRVPEFPVGEKALSPAELERADDVFISSTTRDLLPVLEIDGRPTRGRNRARAVLQEVFSAYVTRYIAARAHASRG